MFATMRAELWNMPEGYRIRQVTPESFEQDLLQGPLRIPPDTVEGLLPYIESGERCFYFAETDLAEPVGRVAVNLSGSVSPSTREHTGRMPNLAFMHVLDQHRNRGVGSALIRGVLGEARQR